MGVDFDVAEFCRKLRPQDPPYTCPVESCGKQYHSIFGINYHLTKYEHKNQRECHSPPPLVKEPSPPPVMTPKTPANKISHPKPRSSIKSSRKKKSSHRAHLLKNAIDQKMVIPPREGLTYVEAQTMVEFDLNGSSVRYNISDPLPFVSKEVFESEHGQTNVKQEPNESLSQTPVSSKKHSHTSSSKKKSSNKASANAKATPAAANEEKVRLPEPCFKILDNYNIADAPPRPTLAYIRFIERSAEEMDGEVEYDMDEEDTAWLSIINERRATMSLPPVPIDAFELLMDRLEKESYFQMQVNGPPGDSAPSIIDDDAVCCICMDGECQNSNVILFCDMCNLAVHQDCYGVPYIPEGQWLCRRCLQSPSRAVDCVLCPNNGGAFKQTDRSLWAHVVCALWIPEVRFANTVFLEPIDSIETIPPARWKLTCYICKQRGVGACIQCHKTNCYAAFHVTCAQHAGLYMKMDTVRDSEPGPVMVQKTAYCDAHTPPDAEPRPRINSKTGGGILAISPPKEIGSPNSVGSGSGPGSPDRPREEKREKMKEARRILAKRRSCVPIISIPTIPPERIQEIASLVTLPKKNQFIQRLIAYWTLKRQFRNGVPLLRRLQSSHPQRRDDARAADATNDTVELLRQLKYWQCLRQDLERARLLCELVRKREKMKREYIKVVEMATLLRLNPFQNFLLRVLDAIQSKDQGEIFAEPVDLDEVPDYMDVVKQPMDLSTIRHKIENFAYHSLDELQADFNLMVANCLAYNSKETMYYRAGVRMRDQGGAVLRQARRDFDHIGFDPETGLLLPTNDVTTSAAKSKSVAFRSARPIPEKRVATPDSENSDKPNKVPRTVDRVSAEIDAKLATLTMKGSIQELEKTLGTLLELQDLARTLKSAVARNKRTRSLRMEIAKARRKISTLTKKASKQDTDTADTNEETEEEEEEEEGQEEASSECDDDLPLAKSLSQDPHGKKREAENPGKYAQSPTSQSQASLQEEKSHGSGKRGRKRRSHRDGSEDEAEPSGESNKTSSMAPMTTPSTPEKDSLKGVSSPVTPVHGEELNSSANGGLNNSRGSLSSASPSGVNRRTAVLFTRKAAGVFRKPDTPGPASPASIHSESSSHVPSKRRAGRPKKNLDVSLGISPERNPGVSSNIDSSDADSASRLMPAPPAPVLNSDSFRVYRSGGDIVTETDEDTQSDTSCSSCSSTEDLSGSSCCEEEGEDDADSGASSFGLDCTSPRTGSGDEGEGKRERSKIKGPLLPPLQLVWAKCRGYPWYPALIIDPKMPAGYVHHGVPIPAPPPDVLALAANYSEPVHLVLFFDTKRTWQWLPRNKLELLGEDRSLDQSKLTESRKPTDRKAVRKAYQEAMLHRREVTGLEGGLIDDSEILDEAP